MSKNLKKFDYLLKPKFKSQKKAYFKLNKEFALTGTLQNHRKLINKISIIQKKSNFISWVDKTLGKEFRANYKTSKITMKKFLKVMDY